MFFPRRELSDHLVDSFYIIALVFRVVNSKFQKNLEIYFTGNFAPVYAIRY